MSAVSPAQRISKLVHFLHVQGSYHQILEAPWMQPASLFPDWRYGVRQLRRNPGFAATSVLTLALRIGANVALFSVVRNVLLKPLPYLDPERLVRVWMDNRRLQM